MIQKITLFITLFAYAVIVSQPLMYLLSLKNVQLALGGSSYTELRQLTDANMRSHFPIAIYTALLSNLLLVFLHIKNPAGFYFIASFISLLLLVADILLMTRGNMPLNNIINSWSMQSFPANWQEIRAAWFRVFAWRQVVSIAGFIVLLLLAVFGKK